MRQVRDGRDLAHVEARDFDRLDDLREKPLGPWRQVGALEELALLQLLLLYFGIVEEPVRVCRIGRLRELLSLVLLQLLLQVGARLGLAEETSLELRRIGAVEIDVTLFDLVIVDDDLDVVGCHVAVVPSALCFCISLMDIPLLILLLRNVLDFIVEVVHLAAFGIVHVVPVRRHELALRIRNLQLISQAGRVWILSIFVMSTCRIIEAFLCIAFPFMRVQVSDILADPVCLHLLALRDELLRLSIIEFEEEIELVADGATHIVLDHAFLSVIVARVHLEELLGSYPLLLSFYISFPDLVAQNCHLYVRTNL